MSSLHSNLIASSHELSQDFPVKIVIVVVICFLFKIFKEIKEPDVV
jgi:hypothetical protein